MSTSKQRKGLALHPPVAPRACLTRPPTRPLHGISLRQADGISPHASSSNGMSGDAHIGLRTSVLSVPQAVTEGLS